MRAGFLTQSILYPNASWIGIEVFWKVEQSWCFRQWSFNNDELSSVASLSWTSPARSERGPCNLQPSAAAQWVPPHRPAPGAAGILSGSLLPRLSLSRCSPAWFFLLLCTQSCGRPGRVTCLLWPQQQCTWPFLSGFHAPRCLKRQCFALLGLGCIGTSLGKYGLGESCCFGDWDSELFFLASYAYYFVVSRNSPASAHRELSGGHYHPSGAVSTPDNQGNWVQAGHKLDSITCGVSVIPLVLTNPAQGHGQQLQFLQTACSSITLLSLAGAAWAL